MQANCCKPIVASQNCACTLKKKKKDEGKEGRKTPPLLVNADAMLQQ